MNGWLLALLITAAILGILLLLRFGLRVAYSAEDLRIWLCISRLRIRIYSSAKKKALKEKKSKTNNAKEKKKKKKPEKQDSEKKVGKKRSLGEILALISEAGGILARLIRRIRVEELRGHIVAAGPDAAAAAIAYGRIWAAVGTLHALLDNLVTLRRFAVDVSLDYSAEKIRAEGTAEIGFRNLYILAAVLGLVRALWGHRNLLLESHGSPRKLIKNTATDAARSAAES